MPSADNFAQSLRPTHHTGSTMKAGGHPLDQQVAYLAESAAFAQPRPMTSSCSSRPSSAYGPERFFYDKSSYTGVHAKGGLQVLDAVPGELRLEQHKGSNFTRNGGHPLDSDKLRDGGLGTAGASVVKKPSRKKSVRRGSRNSSAVRSSGHSLGGQDAAQVEATSGLSVATSTTASPHSSRRSSPSPHVGPERFFYDKSSYTGVHSHGGPTVVDAGWTVGDLRLDQQKGSNFTRNGGHPLDSDKVRDRGLGPSAGPADLRNSLRPNAGSSFVKSSGHPLDHNDATHVESRIHSPARPSIETTSESTNCQRKRRHSVGHVGALRELRSHKNAGPSSSDEDDDSASWADAMRPVHTA